MPDIQMIMEAPQAIQASGTAAPQGADGGEVFGKALSQAKTTIDDKSGESARGRRDSADSAPSERAAEAKEAHRGKARRQDKGMPNLPTRQPSEKPATNGPQNIEPPTDKRGQALAEPGPRLKTRREAWAEMGLELPDSLSEGAPLQFWRGDAPSAADSAGRGHQGHQDDQQDAELSIVIQQIASNMIGDAMLAVAPPEIVHYDAAIQEEVEAAPQPGDNAANEKGIGTGDIWYVLDEDGKVVEAKDDSKEASAAATASIEAAEKKSIDAATERFRGGIESAQGETAVPAERASSKPSQAERDDAQSAERKAQSAGRKGQAEKREAQGETAPKITHYGAGPGKGENTEKPGADTNAAQDAKAQANSHHSAQQSGDKSLADAEHALGLRHEMTAGSEEDNAKPAVHFRNGQAPREIESALPKDNKGQIKAQDKAQDKTVGAKEANEAKETKAQRVQSEEAAAAKASQNRHAKANFRTQLMESEEEQNSGAAAEKPHGEARQAGHRRGASSAREAADEAAAHRSASEGNAPGKGTKEPGAAAPRGRRHGPAAPSGQDSLNAKASEAARPAPPPMRMDAAPQSRAQESANSAAKSGAKGDQSSQNNQGSQGAQNSQASQNSQTNNGGHGSQNGLGGQNSSNSQNNQGQSPFAAHRGEGETASAKPGAAQAKPSDGSASHSNQFAAADSKSTIPVGSTLGGTGHAHSQGQAMPGAPALPGSTEHQQAHAPSGKPQLPPQAPMAQMDGSVKWMLRNDQQAAEIQLYPEHLGKVTIRLRVEGNEVHARVWASEASTLPALREQRAFLESSLKEQGLQLSSFDLQHGKGGQQMQGGEGQNRPQGQNFHFGAQMIESWNGSEFRQELPSQATNQATSQVAAPSQNGGRVELYA